MVMQSFSYANPTHHITHMFERLLEVIQSDILQNPHAVLEYKASLRHGAGPTCLLQSRYSLSPESGRTLSGPVSAPSVSLKPGFLTTEFAQNLQGFYRRARFCHVAKRLQTVGYETALVGKWHLKKAPSGFDYWNIIRDQGTYRDPTMCEMDFSRGHKHRGAYCMDLFTDVALK